MRPWETNELIGVALILLGLAAYQIYSWLQRRKQNELVTVTISDAAVLKTVDFDTLDERIVFPTDTASLALFDPAVLQHRIGSESDDVWLAESDFHEMPEVASGDISLVALGADGFYELRLTRGDLTSDEKRVAKRMDQQLGCRVASGKLCIGGGETLPALGNDTEMREGEGEVLALPNGQYVLTVYGLEPPDDNASLPDIVVQIQPRTAPIALLTKEPSLFR